jgi:hypothetical protein
MARRRAVSDANEQVVRIRRQSEVLNVSAKLLSVAVQPTPSFEEGKKKDKKKNS